jgi:hypothetical protein
LRRSAADPLDPDPPLTLLWSSDRNVLGGGAMCIPPPETKLFTLPIGAA